MCKAIKCRRKTGPVLSAVLILFLLFFPLFRSSALAYTGPALIVDDAGLLTNEEINELEKLAEEISDRHACSVSVVFVKSMGTARSIQDFTDDFFDQYSYGYNDTEDGIMLLISMAEREFHMSTCGNGITTFTDAGLEYLEDEFVSKLSNGDYAGATKRFLNACDRFLTQAENSSPYDVGNLPAKKVSPVQIGIALVGGFLLGGLPIIGQKKALKSVKPQTGASAYAQGGGIQLSARDDHFVTRSLNKVPIPKDTGSRSGGSSGGSSTHFSSGGFSHGGRSGKF